MKKLKILFLSLFLILIILTGCTKTGEDPAANKLPDTKILSYTVSTVAELDTSGNYTSDYTVTVYWSGSDVDGSVLEYNYSVDGGTWEKATSATEHIVMSFQNTTDTHVLSVAAIDDRGGVDQSPASETIFRNNDNIETSFIDGPHNGAGVSSSVVYKVGSSVGVGYVASIMWRVDDGSVLSGTVTPDALNEAEISIDSLAVGPHIVYFTTVRDDGLEDQTPLSVSFIVKSTFTPYIVNNSAVTDGGGWFSGASIPFAWSGIATHYYGLLDETAPFSFSWDDAANFDNSANALASGWVDSTNYGPAAADVTAGIHVFYLKVRDKTGAIGISSITVNVAAFNPTLGILLIDDFSWAPGFYGSDAAIDAALASGFFNGYSFTERPHTAAMVTPDDLSSYSSVVLYGDYGFGNQANNALFTAYALAGGNLFICGYNLVSFAPNMPDFGLYPGIFGLDDNNWTGMDGQPETAYENMHIDVISSYASRSYHRFYDDQPNTQSIFALRGADGDHRSCAVRADMPLGNVALFVGQSLPFMDQTQQDTKDFGDYVLGTEFGESK